MVSCLKCAKENSLDSRFCRSCGETLPDALIQTERQKLDEIIAEGYRLFSAGQIEEALAIAQTAGVTNPSNGGALSLKGMCYERAGKVAEALDCYEQVLAVNPDSALDKIKVNQLRNMLHRHIIAEQQPNRKMAFAMGGLAMVVFATIATAAVLAGSTKPPVDNPNQANLVSTNDLKGFASDPKQKSTATESKVNPPAIDPKSVSETSGHPDGNTGSSTSGHEGEAKRWADNRGTLPNGSDSELRPWQPPIPEGPIGKQNSSTSKVVDNDPPPTPNKGNGDVQPKIEPKDNDGIIMIHRSADQDSNFGGSQDVHSATASSAKLARDQFMLGHYDKAADLYEKALSEGNDSGSVNQRLGQCYEKLGKSSQAVSAYKRSMNAYESELRNGGDNPRVKSALESCKQALKVLQGGS